MLMNVEKLRCRVVLTFIVGAIAGAGPCQSPAWAQLQSPAVGQFEGLRAPLNIPLILAGNFGELRSDHFHTGLDFKTEGREGLPVIAASDGVISRVKISPFGYGRALYLNSPDGLTTVYAHLREFSPEVEQWATDRQYARQAFELDESPRRAFTFQQGDTLGWSGNSGGSAGPHLHFEVRETATQRAINPFFWGFDVADGTRPDLQGLWVLPVNGASVNGSNGPVRFEVNAGTIRTEGPVRFAVEAQDRLDGASNRCGIYRSELWVDGALWFAWQLDTLDFAYNRDMNAHAVYDAWERTGRQVHRMHRLPGNRLGLYQAEDLSAVLSSGDSARSRDAAIEVRIWDVHGNANSARWNLRMEGARGMPAKRNPYDKPFDWSQGGAHVHAAAGTFYEDFLFELSSTPSREGQARWTVGSWEVPIAKPVRVELPIDSGWMDQKGLVVARFRRDGGLDDTYIPEAVEDGRVVFETKTLGEFQVILDTLPPRISPHQRHRASGTEVLRVGNIAELRFNASDALSGVERWGGTLNGDWILMRWDPKLDRMWYALTDDKHAGLTGPQSIEIWAEDAAGNRTSWKGKVQFD